MNKLRDNVKDVDAEESVDVEKVLEYEFLDLDDVAETLMDVVHDRRLFDSVVDLVIDVSVVSVADVVIVLVVEGDSVPFVGVVLLEGVSDNVAVFDSEYSDESDRVPKLRVNVARVPDSVVDVDDDASRVKDALRLHDVVAEGVLDSEVEIERVKDGVIESEALADFEALRSLVPVRLRRVVVGVGLLLDSVADLVSDASIDEV